MHYLIMEILYVFIKVSLLFTIISEASSFFVYGRIMDNESVLGYLKRYETFSVNSLDNSIISGDIDWTDIEKVLQKIREGDFISYTRMSLLSKYYINGKGRVRSWSKASKEIDKLYKISEVK